jgi:hypothetical protein
MASDGREAKIQPNTVMMTNFAADESVTVLVVTRATFVAVSWLSSVIHC